MEALGSPSILRAPMGGGMLSEYRKLVIAMTGTTTIYFLRLPVSNFLRLSREKSVKSMCYLKIYIKVYLMNKTNHA